MYSKLKLIFIHNEIWPIVIGKQGKEMSSEIQKKHERKKQMPQC